MCWTDPRHTTVQPMNTLRKNSRFDIFRLLFWNFFERDISVWFLSLVWRYGLNNTLCLCFLTPSNSFQFYPSWKLSCIELLKYIAVKVIKPLSKLYWTVYYCGSCTEKLKYHLVWQSHRAVLLLSMSERLSGLL